MSTTTQATLSDIAREGGVAYDDMVRDGGGIGAIGPADRERIVRYEDTFGARNWPLVKAMADVAEAAAHACDCRQATGSEGHASYCRTGAALDRLDRLTERP